MMTTNAAVSGYKQRKCNTKTEFKCLRTKFCIDRSLMCDLNRDCFDGSDETDLSCSKLSSTTSTQLSRYKVVCLIGSAFQCDFEKDMCGFTNDETGDDFDWSSSQGSTYWYSSLQVDHTTGNSSGENSSV